jgi:hypothetical protein
MRLAITLSVLAAIAAAILHTMGILSQPTIVLGVIVVGFVTSWVRTGRVEQSRSARHRGHRAVRVPVRGVHFPVS